MASEYPPCASRFFDFRAALGIPLALMVVLLVYTPDAIDFALAHLFYEPGQGFIGKTTASAGQLSDLYQRGLCRWRALVYGSPMDGSHMEAS